ncbi:uncharacterized protein A1O9_04486 [Exophiala aquamarina CBS 119918]|uniref:Uncharacterized protein n=1 Tax=Exophiala aquamarina CBS 119918 TaxID=1182545 RepID=A0A072PVN6_9EURO|nr:uncharacterized protein A1O9_04486 [Exophiala aquamarina CBS 119918]KEF59640.1 hypothetical protein A1O9_04486 [Exophiala aquamarina CBS 119918]
MSRSRVSLTVDSAFDKKTLLLYVFIHQDFRLRVVPFYKAPVELVTVLQLVKGPSTSASTSDISWKSPEDLSLTPDNQNGKTNHAKADVLETEPSTPNKGKKKVLFTSPTDDRKKTPALPTENAFSVLASPSPCPVPEAKDNKERYYIQSQNDLYQTNEWIKFLMPWGIGGLLMVVWQFAVTLLCVAGSSWYDFLTGNSRKTDATCDKVLGKNDKGVALGVD